MLMKLTTGKKHQYRNFRVKILRWEKYWKILWIFWCGIENHVQIFRYPFLSDTKIYIFAFASDWFNIKKIRIWKGLDVSKFVPFFKSVFQNNVCIVKFQNNIQWNLFKSTTLGTKKYCPFLTSGSWSGVNFNNILWTRFLHKSELSSFSLITFGFVIFWCQNIGKKVTHKMLKKLTPEVIDVI